MFTVRLETHNLSAADYEMYECPAYKVLQNCNTQKSLMLYSADEKPAQIFEVGDNAPYRCAYVTNDTGKTIDTVRCAPSSEMVNSSR
jgi:hypothetical protein